MGLDVLSRYAKRGIESISVTEGMASIKQLLGPTTNSSQVMVAPFNWGILSQGYLEYPNYLLEVLPQQRIKNESIDVLIRQLQKVTEKEALELLQQKLGRSNYLMFFKLKIRSFD